MASMYYAFVVMSAIFLIYTILNVALTIKFLHLLPTMLREKYFNIIKIPRLILVISIALFLINFFIPIILVKILVVVLSIFLNVYSLSEISVLKEYI